MSEVQQAIKTLEKPVLRRFMLTMLPTLGMLLVTPFILAGLAAAWKAVLSDSPPFSGIWVGIFTGLATWLVFRAAEARWHGYELMRRLYRLQGDLKAGAPDELLEAQYHHLVEMGAGEK